MSADINAALAKLRKDHGNTGGCGCSQCDFLDAIPEGATLRIEEPGGVYIRITREDMDPDVLDCLLDAAVWRIGEEVCAALETQT